MLVEGGVECQWREGWSVSGGRGGVLVEGGVGC